MTQTTHIQPSATGGRPPSDKTGVHTGERKTDGFRTLATRNILYHNAMKALPSQGRVGRGFFGAERVSSRIGGGLNQTALLDPLNSALPPLTDPPDYSYIVEDLGRMLQRQISCVGMNPSYVVMESQFHSVEHSTHHSDPEDNWYIYHSDHLGSSAFLTDIDGTPTQHLQYLPFGESFIEQRSFTEYYTPYTFSAKERDLAFSAKERDLETGYSYFGARYYDAGLSIWLSVDPLAHKYPSMSAYMYCAGNPVMLVDPDGREIVPTEEQAVRVIKSYLLSFPGVTEANFKQAFGIKIDEENNVITGSGTGSGKNGTMTQREFRKNYRHVTGERIRRQQLDDAYKFHYAASSDIRVEFIVFISPKPTLGQTIPGTTFHNEFPGISRSANYHPELIKLENILKWEPPASENEFNWWFNEAKSCDSGTNWKIFGYINPRDNNGLVLQPHEYNHRGTMVINGNTANSMQKRQNALREMLRLF